MYINADKVTMLHVEPTSKCNASCPGCPRNNCGYGVKKSLILQDLDPDIIIAEANKLINLKVIHLCGNVGDAIAYKYLNKAVDKVVAQNEFFRIIKANKHWSLSIATNGSLRSTKWWEELGKKCNLNLFKSHRIQFGIDGLEDTNHIYRQATNFNKIIDNAKAFIDAGGVAEWQYLKFKHNQHQVDEARQLANDIGFDRFFIQQPYLTVAHHWKTGERYYLEPADNKEFDRNRLQDNSLLLLNQTHENQVWKKEYTTKNNYVEDNNCMHIDIDADGSYNYSLFLTVRGEILPCCYFDEVGVVQEKDFDMKTLDIKTEFNSNEYRFTCRRMCGSIK